MLVPYVHLPRIASLGLFTYSCSVKVVRGIFMPSSPLAEQPNASQQLRRLLFTMGSDRLHAYMNMNQQNPTASERATPSDSFIACHEYALIPRRLLANGGPNQERDGEEDGNDDRSSVRSHPRATVVELLLVLLQVLGVHLQVEGGAGRRGREVERRAERRGGGGGLSSRRDGRRGLGGEGRGRGDDGGGDEEGAEELVHG